MINPSEISLFLVIFLLKFNFALIFFIITLVSYQERNLEISGHKWGFVYFFLQFYHIPHTTASLVRKKDSPPSEIYVSPQLQLPVLRWAFLGLGLEEKGKRRKSQGITIILSVSFRGPPFPLSNQKEKISLVCLSVCSWCKVPGFGFRLADFRT